MNLLEKKAIESVLATRDLAAGKLKISSAMKIAAHMHALFREAIAYTQAQDEISDDEAKMLSGLVDGMSAVLEMEE